MVRLLFVLAAVFVCLKYLNIVVYGFIFVLFLLYVLFLIYEINLIKNKATKPEKFSNNEKNVDN